jgi:peptide/nickel transport system permease protein
MTAYLVKRLLAAIPTLLIILLMVIVVVRIMPGDVIDAAIADQARLNDVDRAAMEERLGLNKSLPQQYVEYLGGLVQGDLGKSLWTGREIRSMIGDRVVVTLELAFIAFVLALVVSVPIGILSAKFRGSFLDAGLRGFASVGLSVPEFMTATAILVLPAVWWQWSPQLYVGRDAGFFDHYVSLLVPAAIVAWRLASTQARLIRTMMIEVFSQDYIRTARAKGLAESRIIMVHAFRNAMIPVITLASLEIVWLLSGIVIVEQVFGIPGLGSLLLEGVRNRDYATVQGITMLFGVLVVLLNIGTDLFYGVLDPRVRQA